LAAGLTTAEAAVAAGVAGEILSDKRYHTTPRADSSPKGTTSQSATQPPQNDGLRGAQGGVVQAGDEGFHLIQQAQHFGQGRIPGRGIIPVPVQRR
jgi:hypothetical protein